MSYPSSRTSVRFWICAASLLAASWCQAGTITPVTGGFLLTGTHHRIFISDTNGSLVTIAEPGGAPIASGGEAGLWHLAVDVDGSGSKTGFLHAAMFSPSPSANSFSWSLPAPSNVLHLVYSNAAVTVTVSASNHADGVDLAASVAPRTTNILSLTLPGPLRFDPASVERFVAPNHSSDGVGMAYHANYFALQPEDDPASWKSAIVGPGGYINLYGAPLTFGTNNAPVSLAFTTNGAAWLGSSVTSAWSSASAIVNRPPAPGQADVVLIDSPEGAFLSGSRLGGGSSAGYLMRIGGPIRASEVNLSLDVVAGTIEHLAGNAGGRSIVALLSLVRGPVVGANWPSEVRLDQWRTRLASSPVLASNGISYLELSTLPEIIAALNNTNVFAILNPYGELVPASLSGGVTETVTNIGNFVRNGGHWFEVAGYPFFQTLQPERYYTNNIFYPPAFADFLHLATTNGQAAVYGVQPLPSDPWAGVTNVAALFVPGRLIWGADATGGWMQRAFGTYIPTSATWTSPTVRIAIGHTPEAALADYRTANVLNRNLDAKMDAPTLEAFRQSIMIHLKGGATQMTARLDDLPAPTLLHFEEYLFGGFDKQYPDHLPPNPSFGTVAEFTNFLAQARARNQLTMPYTNPTFWGVDPKGPTFLATNDAPLLLNLDGSINLEEYFGEAGFTVTPWHPAVQAANRNTRNQFLTNYPVDVIFHDQIGARTWQYDLNPESPTPYAYMAGIAAIAAEDSQFLPTSTENGWDRLINHNAQFAGLAWGLAPTTNAPFWRRYLRDRYNPDTWEIYPLAQHLAHDKVSFTYNNLDAAVHNHEVMAWTLGLGYSMTFVIRTTELDQIDKRQWMLWIDRVQKSVAARYMGQGVQSFTHHWGTNAVTPDNGAIASHYGDVGIHANLGPQPLTTNGWTLAPYGYLATAPGLVAAHILAPGDTNAVAYVAETNTSGGLDIWIHGTGNRTVSLVLPPGYNGLVTTLLDGGSPVQTTVSANILPLSLGSTPTTNAYLWQGTITPVAAAPILIDFGRHDGGINGILTASPDSHGNHWNNVGPATQVVPVGTASSNLVNATNGTTTVAVTTRTGGWNANGLLNGGLFQPYGPQTNLLGAFAIETATMDYFFTSTNDVFTLSGLNTGSLYTLTFFGSRSDTVERVTSYAVGITSVTLRTSGPQSSASAAGTNRNDHALAVLSLLSPSSSGDLTVRVTKVSGAFAHLNLMQIEEIPPVPASAPAMLVSPSSLDFTGTEGGASPAAQTFGLTNIGNATLNYTITSNAPWLSISPVSGSLAAGVGQTITVTVNTAGLLAGTSNATITIAGPAATNTPQTVGVNLTINPPAPSGPTTQAVYLVDFGPNDVTNGDITLNPDHLNQHWNNLVGTGGGVGLSSITLSNLITTTSNASTLAIITSASGWGANGKLNGGLLAPSDALLGNLAVTNATQDYFTTTTSAGFTLSGLNTALVYNLVFFGTRDTTITRVSTYSTGTNSVSLTTSGTGIGAGGANQNNNTTAVLRALAPNASGQIPVTVTATTGGFAYLGILKIEEVSSGTASNPPAPPVASTQALYRVDLGRHDGGVNGTATTNPDTNGHYWNNVGPTTEVVPNGTAITNLVNTTNGPSAIGLSVITAGWRSNGKLNGGLLAPSPALLGDLAIATATEDYFFTQGTDTFRLSGLDPAQRYNLRFFGTRESTSTRITTYSSGFASTNLQTSGTAIGDGGYNGNNNTLAALYSLAPNPSGQIDVTVAVNTGGFAYLGILEIEAFTPAPATNAGPAISASPTALAFITTNGAPPPAAATFSVTNTGTGNLSYTVATNAAWLSVSPTAGSLAAGTGQSLTVTVNAAGLPLGISSALIAISDPAATNSPQTVSVTVQVKSADPLLAVFGSSVAKGWNSSGQFADPDVFEQGGSWSNGYAALMTQLLAAQGGPTVTNVSTPGDNTAGGLAKFGTYVLPLAPDYALIAYSLGNEGLSSSPNDASSSNIVATFTANLLALIELCRTNGIQPVISSVYPHGGYTTNHYAHLKRMHLTINTWNVPSLNLLTPVDDGAGQWIDGYWSDAAHPNDAGYAEFFYSFVPSLFDALAAGKNNTPSFGSPNRFARLTASPGVTAPFSFTPSNSVHAFTTSFRLRTTTTGTIAAVRSGSDYATLELRAGQLVYIDRSGTETVMATDLADGAWHDIALSARYALSNTTVYVNGTASASIPERFTPDQFILGGPGDSGRAATPSSIDLDAWCVYRAGWTPDEALAQENGFLQQSSMEIGAMFDEAAFTNGAPAVNAAQSLSQPVVNTPGLEAISDAPETKTLLIFGSSVAQGYHGPGSPGYTNGSFALGYGGRLTPLLEQTGWLVTNRSVGGNNTTLLNARFDTDAVPVNPNIILIGLSLGNEGLVFNPDPEIPFESFRSGMTNLIHRSRTNGFYPVVTLAYPHTLYDATKYAYVKRMNLEMNTWDVPGVNLLGAVDNGAGQWAEGHTADDAHPNPTGYQEIFAAFVPSLFDAIQLGKTNRPSLTGTPGFARVINGGSAPLTFTPDRTMRGFTTAFRVRATQTGTVAAALSSTGSVVVASPARFLIDFGRHDGVNGNTTTSPDANGNHWNNLSPANPATNTFVAAGTTLANLVTTSNLVTSAGILIPTVGWQANGIFNGGLLAPSNSLLGDLAVASATEDYFFIGGSAPITLTGLNPDSTYTLRFFGSRDTTETRTTIFAVRTNATALTTSGTGIGTYATNQNDNTVAQLTNIVPDPDGNIEVLVIRSAGSLAHLNLMEVIEIPGDAQPRGGRIELRDNTVAYVSADGSELTAPVDADRGAWIDIALSHSTARNRTLLYVDGVFAGSLPEIVRPMQFVLGGPGPLANAPPPPATVDLQDWCVYRAPWTPEEAMAQHTGALQHASMEIGAPLHDATFTPGASTENRAQSLSTVRITGTNLTAGTTLAPPDNLQAVSPAFNTVTLTWSDNSAGEDGFVLERRLAGLGGPWTIRADLPANTSTHTEFSVAAATYEYRVSVREGLLQGEPSSIATITVTDPPSASESPISTLQFSGGQPSLTFIGSNAVLYTLQYTTNLLHAGGWLYVLTNGSPVLTVGNGTDLRTLTDTNLPDSVRAYRLMTAPPNP